MGSVVGSGLAPNRRVLVATPWLLGVALVWIGSQSVQAPSALPADAPVGEFSAGRAIDHVDVIASEPHPMGTRENKVVREYIVAELEKLGLETELHPTIAPDYFVQGGTVTVVNVVARIPGTANTKAVALMAHYDTVPTTPGGNDNSAAVAALLETARALTSEPSHANDVLLIFTDGEEPAPRFGATALIREPSLAAGIGLVVNFEAIGGSGPSLLVETSGPEGWIVGEFARATPQPVAFSFITELVGLMGDIGTDFDPFRNAGVPGLHFAYLRESPLYHTTADDVESVGLGSLQHHGVHALGIARHFGDLDLSSPPPSDEAVFFTIRPLFIKYPTAWVIPLAVAVIALYSVVAAKWFKGSARDPVRLLRSAARTAAVGLLATIGATIVWIGIVAVRSTPGTIESYFYFLAILAIAVYVGARFCRGRPGFTPGILLIWVTFAMLTAAALPGFSYLFTWPALAAAAVFLWQPDSSGQRLLRFGLVAAPTLILMIPAVDSLLQLSQPRPGNPDSELASVFAAPLLLALLAAGLIQTVWPHRAEDHETMR